MSQNLYQSITGRILDALESGVVPWRRPWSLTPGLPQNAITRKPYRGVNVLLLSLREFGDPRWLTFRQVRQLGGRVQQGAKAELVVFWKRWEPRTPEDTNDQAPKEKKTVAIPLLRHYFVFNVQQCEDLPQAVQGCSDTEPIRLESADVLVRGMPCPPRIVEQGSQAFYRPSDDVVRVPPVAAFESVEAFYSTLFHELGHATGHPKRLGRFSSADSEGFGSESYSREELVAELTSAFCCGLLGLDNSMIENASSYIGGWLRALSNDPKALVVASAQAQKATDFIQGRTFAGEDLES